MARNRLARRQKIQKGEDYFIKAIHGRERCEDRISYRRYQVQNAKKLELKRSTNTKEQAPKKRPTASQQSIINSIQKS